MVFDLSSLKAKEVDPNEQMIRLLVCRKCKSIDEVPPYDGPEGGENSGDYDYSLRFFVDNHLDHKAELVTYHLPFKYWVVPKVKEGIIQQINQGAQGLDIFGTNFYATKENFSADAMTCWIQHKQTKDCGDYKSTHKILKAGTSVERKALGLEAEGTGPKVYLCDYCPVKSVVQQKAYKKKGYL